MKKVIVTTKAPAPIGPYNQAILAGETLYVSGTIALDLETNKLMKLAIKEETKQECSKFCNNWRTRYYSFLI